MSEQLDITASSQSNLFVLVQIVLPWHVIIHTHAQHRLTGVHRGTLANIHPQPLPCSPSALAVSLIYEVPLIWPKRLLRDLPPLSSLHLPHPSFSSSLSSVSRPSESEKCIAQQAIHRLDTLTNILLSFFLPPSPPVYLTLFATPTPFFLPIV